MYFHGGSEGVHKLMAAASIGLKTSLPHRKDIMEVRGRRSLLR